MRLGDNVAPAQQNAAARNRILVIMMLFLLWFGRCFEPELFVPNTTAGVSDVTANTEVRPRENQRHDGQWNGCLRRSKLCHNSDSSQRSDNVKDINQLLAMTHVLVEPFVSGFINY